MASEYDNGYYYYYYAGDEPLFVCWCPGGSVSPDNGNLFEEMPPGTPIVVLLVVLLRNLIGSVQHLVAVKRVLYGALGKI
jgi:hypothetical protein